LYKHCLAEHPGNPAILPERPLRVKGLRLSHLQERTELRCGLPGCRHTFPHFKGLVRHERTHADAFLCVLCGKPTWSCAALIEHYDTQHKQKSQHLCRACGFFTYSEVTLRKHSLQVHMQGSHQFACTECSYTTSIQSTFAAHVRNHRVQALVCEDCGKEFTTQQALSSHRRCHEAPVHPHSCSYCPKQFPHVSLLNIHERTHTGEKPFQCVHCGQCFGSQSSLIKHNRNLHTPAEEMPYKCSTCGKTFSKARRKVYFGHLKQHSGVKDFKCPVCNSAFSSRGYLGNHFKKVHKRTLLEMERELQEKREEQEELHQV